MYVDAICKFAQTRRYAASRPFLLIKMSFDDNLSRMDAVMWRIQRIENPYNNDWRMYLRNMFYRWA